MKTDKDIDELLVTLDACEGARGWAKGKTWQEIFDTCYRGDWLLWLFKKTMEDTDANLRVLTLAKAHCANTVRHLMKDERSTKTIDIAIEFGLGNLTLKELFEARIVAADAAAYAAAAAADAAAYAAAAAAADADADAADAAADAAAAADADADAADAADARTKNQQQTADICRKYLPIEIWNIKN